MLYESTPVYSGYGSPIKSEISQNEHLCQYTSELDDEKYEPSSKNPSDAIDFIIDSCKKYRDELIIIALGPFTNIAKAIERDKDALMLAGKIVIMGGAYFKQYADWNVMCDVEAAKIMLDMAIEDQREYWKTTQQKQKREYTLNTLGMVFCFILCLALIGTGTYLMATDHYVTGSASVVLALIAVLGSLASGGNNNKQK